MIKPHLEDGQTPDGYYKISDEIYFSTDGLSNSDMGRLLRSPAHYLETSITPTAQMQLGTLVHHLILEPEHAHKHIAVMEPFDGRTKAGKEYKKEFERDNAGKMIVKQDIYDVASKMAGNVLAHPDAKEILEFTEREVASFKTVDGILMKAKADVWAPGQYLADIKTTKSASQGRGGFERSVLDFSYHRQAAHYMNMFDVDRFVFIAVENVEPYLVSVFELAPDYVEAGRKQVKEAMKRYKSIQGKDLKKINLGYPTGIKTLECPYWLAERPSEEGSND